MTSKARPPTTRAANGAPGGAGLFARARAPRDPHRPQSTCALPALGSRKLGAKAGRSQGRLKGADRKAPGASRRSIPLMSRGEGKQGDGRSRQPEKQSPGTAKRWLQTLAEGHEEVCNENPE